MKFKEGDIVKFKVDHTIMQELWNKSGRIIGQYTDPPVGVISEPLIPGAVHWKVVLFSPEDTPKKHGVGGWDYDYWTPNEDKLIKATKLEVVLA